MQAVLSIKISLSCTSWSKDGVNHFVDGLLIRKTLFWFLCFLSLLSWF